jgi:hypothetical protein
VSDSQATDSPRHWVSLGATDPADLLHTRLTLHHAAQLLSSFGQAMLTPIEDDSHRSMTWHAESQSFTTDATDDGLTARLSVRTFTLEVWRDGEQLRALELTGRSPSHALSWLGNEVSGARDASVGRMAWPEYDLPAQPGGQDAPFEPDAASLNEFAAWYGNTESALRDVFGDVAEAAAIRCWPHHFDLATLLTYPAAEPDGEAAYVGIGFSPGDDAIPDPYYYVNGSPFPAPEKLPELAGPGEWHTEGWVGAVLRAGEIVSSGSAQAQEQTVATFLTTAVDTMSTTLLATR